jgi:hypothetical protein
MLYGQLPVNHSKWKAPPYVHWEGMVTFVILAGHQNFGFRQRFDRALDG